MKFARLLIALTILLAVILSCSLPAGTGFRGYGPAAEIKGDYWFYVTEPLTLENLRGRVVLLQVWKFT